MPTPPQEPPRGQGPRPPLPLRLLLLLPPLLALGLGLPPLLPLLRLLLASVPGPFTEGSGIGACLAQSPPLLRLPPPLRILLLVLGPLLPRVLVLVLGVAADCGGRCSSPRAGARTPGPWGSMKKPSVSQERPWTRTPAPLVTMGDHRGFGAPGAGPVGAGPQASLSR